MIQLEPEGSTKETPLVRNSSLRLRRWSYDPSPAESNSQPHAHAQATKTTISIKNQETKDHTKRKTSVNLIFKIFLKDVKIIKAKIVEGDC
ncbi:hypothetical protein Tco_0735241 [Tanacetum coccineum]